MVACGAGSGSKGATERCAAQGAGQPQADCSKGSLHVPSICSVAGTGQVLCSKPHSAVRSACFLDEQTKNQRGWDVPWAPEQEEAEPGLKPRPVRLQAPAFNPRLCLSVF